MNDSDYDKNSMKNKKIRDGKQYIASASVYANEGTSYKYAKPV